MPSFIWQVVAVEAAAAAAVVEVRASNSFSSLVQTAPERLLCFGATCPTLIKLVVTSSGGSKIILPTLTTSLMHLSSNGCENVLQ